MENNIAGISTVQVGNSFAYRFTKPSQHDTMDSSTDTRIESDKAGIVTTEAEEDESSSVSSKLKSYCFISRHTAVPIIISTISLFLAIGLIIGVSMRWAQMNDELKRLQVLVESIEIEARAQASVALALKSSPKKRRGPTPPAGTTYIHWGKKTCGANSELVYSGFGAGSASASRARGGGGAEYLCMPNYPEYNKFDSSGDTAAHSWIYSSEYMSYQLGIFPDRVHGHNVACSVCLAPRSAKTMIPAKRTCPVGWTREYEGYLMSSYVADRKMSYECVDADPDVIGGTQNVTGGASLYFVSGYCGEYGGLSHCPTYVSARELTCVVCTK